MAPVATSMPSISAPQVVSYKFLHLDCCASRLSCACHQNMKIRCGLTPSVARKVPTGRVCSRPTWRNGTHSDQLAAQPVPRGRRSRSCDPEGDAMIDQAFIDAFQPERRSEYARQHARPMAQRAIQTDAPEPARHCPLPSAREIDAALHVKYGATRYGDRQRGGERSRRPASFT
jgi:hypothetical protein